MVCYWLGLSEPFNWISIFNQAWNQERSMMKRLEISKKWRRSDSEPVFLMWIMHNVGQNLHHLPALMTDCTLPAFARFFTKWINFGSHCNDSRGALWRRSTIPAFFWPHGRGRHGGKRSAASYFANSSHLFRVSFISWENRKKFFRGENDVLYPFSRRGSSSPLVRWPLPHSSYTISDP